MRAIRSHRCGRAEPVPQRPARAARTCAGTRCAASGSRTRRIGRTALSFRRPSTTRSRRRPAPTSRPRCRRATGKRRCSTTASPRWLARRHDAPTPTCRPLPADGRCEVVVFTHDPAGSLGALPLEHIALLLEVWADRSAAWARATTLLRLPVREPRRRGRRDAASSARADLRLSRRAADPGADDAIAAACRDDGRGPLAAMIVAERRGGSARCTKVRTRRRSSRCARATRTRCGSRRAGRRRCLASSTRVSAPIWRAR